MQTKQGDQVATGLLEDYAKAVSSGDLERWMTLWTDSGVQMAPDAPARSGRDEVRAAMEPLFDLYEHVMSVDPQVIRLAGDWGYVRGEYSHEVSSKVGDERSSRTGKFLTIVERQTDGTWKIACDCFNYNAPAPT